MNENYRIVDSLDSLTRLNIGEGQVGTCYKVNNKVFKKFKSIPRFPGLIMQLSNLHSKSFSFPEEFVYLNEHDIKYLQGYLMKYVDGVKVTNISELTKMKELCHSLDSLEKEIRTLTEEENLLVKDLHPDNVLYTDDGKFKVIDTDFCVTYPDDPVYMYRENMKELGNCMLPAFMGDSNIDNSKVKYLYDLCVLDAKAKPSIVLNEAIEEIQKETKEEVISLHDFKEGMKLIRK